jgi:hypothetical protein
MIDINELKFKLSIIDTTKKQLASARDNFKNLFKNISSSSKTDFGKATKDVENFYKTISKESKRAKVGRGGGALEQTAGVLGAVNREDVALMQAIKEKGKSLQERFRQKNVTEMTKDNSPLGSNTQTTGQAKFHKISANELHVLKITGTGMRGGSVTGQTSSDKLREEMKDVSGTGKGGGAGGALGKAGIVGAIAMAVIGTIYAAMSSRAEAFRTAANQQMAGIQSMGFGSATGPAGLYTGFKSGNKGAMYGLTGAQQVEMMSAFSKQTGAGRNQAESLMTGQNNLAQMQNAFGFNSGQLGGWAGTFQRFGQGKSGMGMLQQSLQGAQNVGMGGARSEEFINDMQEALTQAVYSGSKRSFDDLDKSLGALMKTSDERIKVLAPQILQSSTQAMQQASLLKGGMGESYMYQSVAQMRRQRGESTTPEDISRQLSGKSTGDWLKSMQDMITMTRKQYGGGYQGGVALSNLPGFENIKDVDTINEIASQILGGGVQNKGDLSKILQGRLESIQQPLAMTQMQDVRESTNTITEANKLCADAVFKFRDVIEKGIQSMTNWVGMLDKTSNKYSDPTYSYKLDPKNLRSGHY